MTTEVNTRATWMVRAEGGVLFERFRSGLVAVGWEELGDLSAAADREAVRALYEQAFPEASPGRAANAIGVLHKFHSTIRTADRVVTYNPASREYLIGNIISDYVFDEAAIGPEYPHVRKVKWDGVVNLHIPRQADHLFRGKATT
ncbi:MAG: hypothetical protein GY820_24145 [Gammaproteobacteria bacterium]|nr:hypothetical protein [Gammaproteobacteria bacterium]